MKEKKATSIRSKIFIILLALVLGQSVVFIASIFLVNIPTILNTYAQQVFEKIVQNRKMYLEKEMVDRWGNFEIEAERIVASYNQIIDDNQFLSDEEIFPFFDDAMPLLSKLLLDKTASGAFIILDDARGSGESQSCVYLYNENPYLQKSSLEDFQVLKGPSEIAEKYEISLATNWSTGLELSRDMEKTLKKPINATRSFIEAEVVQGIEHNKSVYQDNGYWNMSVSEFSPEKRMATFSVALVDKNNRVFGVLGLSIEQHHIYKSLPFEDFFSDGYGYIFAKEVNNTLVPLMTNGSIQENFFSVGQPLTLKALRNCNHSYMYEVDKNKIVLHPEQIDLYLNNSYFEEDRIYLVGVSPYEAITYFSWRLYDMLFLLTIITVILALGIIYFVSKDFSNPIRLLSKDLKESIQKDELNLKKIGIKEIDELTFTIENLHKELIENSTRNDRILRMVSVGVGTFEYKAGNEYVDISTTLADMFSFAVDFEDVNRVSGYQFFKVYNNMRKNKDDVFENTYKVSSNPDRWYEVQTLQEGDSFLGVVTDVTKDVINNRDIEYERTHDLLTDIYNRQTFYRKTYDIIENQNLKYSAVVLIDLDNLKQANDTYGHEFGDLYIRKVAYIMKNLFPENVILARMAGDEFLLFFYGFEHREEILENIEIMYNNFNHEVFQLGNDSFAISASSGLAWHGVDSIDLKELIRFADFAMYEGKRKEKGSLTIFNKARYKKTQSSK